MCKCVYADLRERLNAEIKTQTQVREGDGIWASEYVCMYCNCMYFCMYVLYKSWGIGVNAETKKDLSESE